MDIELTLSPDQRLRLALLDRCLPIAGGETAVALAREAYLFVVGYAEAAAPVHQPVAGEPQPQPQPEPEPEPEPAASIPVGKIDMAARARQAEPEVQPQPELHAEPEPEAEPDHRHIATDMTILAAIEAGHSTRSAILEATGIPAGSWHRRIKAALEARVVVEDRTAVPFTYRLVPLEPEPTAPPPVPAATPAPETEEETEEERLKREWLEQRGGPSRKPNLGPHEEVVTFLKSQGMFVARLPAGTPGRARWRYGNVQVDTKRLYKLANQARKLLGQAPIPMPKERDDADADAA